MGEEGESIAHVDVVQGAGAGVKARHGLRHRGSRDIDDRQASCDRIGGVERSVDEVPFDPHVVHARLEAGRITGDDGRVRRIGQVQQGDAVQ